MTDVSSCPTIHSVEWGTSPMDHWKMILDLQWLGLMNVWNYGMIR